MYLEFYAEMKLMNNIFLIVSVVVFSISSYAQECTRSGGGDIYYKDQDGNIIVKYLPGPTRGEPTSEWVAKCSPKVVELKQNNKQNGPSDSECDLCKQKYSGPTRRGVCGQQLGCSFFSYLLWEVSLLKNTRL